MGHPKKNPPPLGPKLTTKEKLRQIKKNRKENLKQKRARLIVRNLPFQVTEDNLRDHFGKFGDIEHVEVLKKEDGLMKGCGFVQFKLVQKAAKARHHTNGKEFFGREISVDFAQAKNKYKKEVKIANQQTGKDEKVMEIKDEPFDDNDTFKETTETDKTEIKSEDENSDVEIKEEDDKKATIKPDDDDNDTSDSESDEDVEDEANDTISEINETQKKPRVESHDVNEGKTIFIKNVPFSARNEDLKHVMRQYGPVYYALICVDKFTEHSKGTAFVKFVNQEDAEKALQAGTELVLQGNILDCHPALARNEIHQKSQDKKRATETPKDSRNLYLVKEGVVLAGSKAAEGVSASDMAKRLQLEQYKTQMLRNLNMFVSRERLIVHNLPPSWDDKKLRALFQKYSPKNSIIKEAKVMRDLKNVNAEGVGMSKEYGFVSFARHEDAVAALRTLNNNPQIFSATKRPIVAFSIENKSMIKARQKRLEKSRLMNPKSKQFDPESVKKIKNAEIRKVKEIDNQETGEKYVGVTAKPGAMKMRSRYNLKTQAQLHAQTLKQEKKRKKFAKKDFKEKREEFTKQPRQKINTKKYDDNFSKLVSQYKKKIMGATPNQKSKWYEAQ